MLAACGLQHDEAITNDQTSNDFKKHVIKPVPLETSSLFVLQHQIPKQIPWVHSPLGWACTTALRNFRTSLKTSCWSEEATFEQIFKRRTFFLAKLGTYPHTPPTIQSIPHPPPLMITPSNTKARSDSDFPDAELAVAQSIRTSNYSPWWSQSPWHWCGSIVCRHWCRTSEPVRGCCRTRGCIYGHSRQNINH